MWILITRTLPILESARPAIYGIYQAKPLKHKFYKNAVTMYATEQITVLEHEYSVLSDDRVDEYIKLGWVAHRIDNPQEPIDLRLLEKGRCLCEEERAIIWALMLDGLTEYQACEEYYKHTHTDFERMTYCYLPPKEMVEAMTQVFGRR